MCGDFANTIIKTVISCNTRQHQIWWQHIISQRKSEKTTILRARIFASVHFGWRAHFPLQVSISILYTHTHHHNTCMYRAYRHIYYAAILFLCAYMKCRFTEFALALNPLCSLSQICYVCACILLNYDGNLSSTYKQSYRVILWCVRVCVTMYKVADAHLINFIRLGLGPQVS